MNKYKVYTAEGRGHYLIWFGDSVEQVRREAESCGHKVVRVVFGGTL